MKVTKHSDIVSITKLLAMIDGDHHLGTYEVNAGRVKIAPHPFACGKSRLVCVCVYVCVYHANDPSINWSLCNCQTCATCAHPDKVLIAS